MICYDFIYDIIWYYRMELERLEQVIECVEDGVREHSDSDFDYENEAENDIGQLLYHRLESDEKFNTEWYEAFVNNKNNDTHWDYFTNYYESAHSWIKRLGMIYQDALRYNSLWWSSSKYSSNIFSILYKKEDITSENSGYDELYKKINNYVITTNSQTHFKGEMKYDRDILKTFAIQGYDELNGQILQRPFISIICNKKQSEKICQYDTEHFYAGFIRCINDNSDSDIDNENEENDWHFNELFHKDYELHNSVCVTKIFFPSIYKVIKTTGVYYGDRKNKTDEWISVIENSGDLVEMFVVYKHWNTTFHEDPTDFLLNQIIDIVSDGHNDIKYKKNHDKYKITDIEIDKSKINDICEAIFFKMEVDSNTNDEWHNDILSISYVPDDFNYYYHTWYELYFRKLIIILKLDYDDILKINNLWWNKANTSRNIFPPCCYKGFISDYDYYDDLIKLNKYVITRTFQSYCKKNVDIENVEQYGKRFDIKHNSDINIIQIRRPYLEIICTLGDAMKIFKIKDVRLCIGYLNLNKKKWCLNNLWNKYYDQNSLISVIKYFSLTDYCDIDTKYIFKSKKAHRLKYIDKQVKINGLDIFGDAMDIAYVKIFFNEWTCDDSFEPTRYMFDKILEVFEK
jgi:hypothetical protein